MIQRRFSPGLSAAVAIFENWRTACVRPDASNLKRSPPLIRQKKRVEPKEVSTRELWNSAEGD